MGANHHYKYVRASPSPVFVLFSSSFGGAENDLMVPPLVSFALFLVNKQKH